MKKLLLTTTLVATLSACSYEPEVVTICEDVYFDGKLGEEMEVRCSSYINEPRYTPTVKNEHPEEPKETEDEEDKPSDPDSIPVDNDDTGDPSGPDKQDRVKGNNGFGNGDQSAPGRSGPRNNAENDKGGRTQRNHGQARSN